MDDWFSDITFLDVEADRAGRPIAIGAVRGIETLQVAGDDAGVRALVAFCGAGSVAGHNLLAHDLPLMAALPVPFSIPPERAIDTLLGSLLADPTRQSHALDKSDALDRRGAVPDPVADALRSRALLAECRQSLSELDAGEAQFYAALLARSGHFALGAALGLVADETIAMPESGLDGTRLARLCRVHLRQLLVAADGGQRSDFLALALAVRFIQLHARDGRLTRPPSAALAHLPRFGEFLARLMGPLCPDYTCPHRFECDVHRPFAEELLSSHFELPAFRAHQAEVVHAVLENRAPLVILPTGGGKSLCYQLPAIHGAERLRGLTVVISPLQALMADQVRSLSQRYPPACLLNASLLMDARRQNLEGLYAGRYHVLYMGPEQLRNPSVLRLLASRPPFLWVIDEAHCVSQWGHSFRTDYTYLPRAIAAIHGSARRPLLALFTATAAAEVQRDIAAQFRAGLGAELTLMDHGGPRDNLDYEVIAVPDGNAKDNELLNLLAAHSDGARLVYCATVRRARELHALLREQSIPCVLYHGQLPPNEKSAELERFLSGRANTAVATSAFGMGIDKPDIRLVVHYEPSGSLEDYVQETGRAGRDGAPARCVLLYDEADLETQFYLKTISRITAREVQRIWNALRVRARRWKHKCSSDGFVELWISAEDLFVEEQLERDLDWSREELQSKLKLVLYHLEADGVCARLENRTRPWGLYPLQPYDEGLHRLPQPPSPATRRVLEYLCDPARPRRLSVLDIAEECVLRPAEAFREVQTLTRLELIGQELCFDVTLARGVARSTDVLMRNAFECANALLDLVEDDGELCVVHLRSAAAAVSSSSGRAVPPHEVFLVLRALRTQGMLRMDRYGPGRYRVEFDPSFVEVRQRLRNLRRVAEAVWTYLDARSGGRRGRDVTLELDVQRFLDEERRLTESFRPEEVVDACLLLHHLETLHLADPPVLLETSMHVRVKLHAARDALDLGRPRRYHEHQISLVHYMRTYATLPPDRRQRFVDDYFALPRKELAARYFRGKRNQLARPVSPATEARLLAGLTDAQREAVIAEDSALLVVAGPGSGKTHTVVRRVCHMVRARQIRPAEILILSFNRAAVIELRRRLRTELGERARGLDIRTFHSLALRLTGAQVMSEHSDPEAQLSRAVVDAAKLLEGEPEGEPDEHAESRERAVGQVRHVLVDEYQDLDPDQYRLLAALLGKSAAPRPAGERTERSVYVVGDDDQAIYGFRKASVEFLRSFEEEFAARRVFLADNFRSRPEIVELARTFIEQSPGRMKKPDEVMRPQLAAAHGGENTLRCFRYRDLEQLSAHAAYIVERSFEQSAGAIAVLARNWSDLDTLRGHLEEAGIPFVLHHGDHHRPVHRRHPAEQLLRQLQKEQQTLEGSAAALLRERVQLLGRDAAEPSVAALIAFAEDLDAERAIGPADSLVPISYRELCDTLVLSSRDAAMRGAMDTVQRVHLSTFHGAKGLEFDKVVVYPSAPAATSDRSEEQRLYYVALTRARDQLVVCTLAQSRELAVDLALAPQDLGATVERLRAPAVGFLDCTPEDVWLGGRELGVAQRTIYSLREGDVLQLKQEDGRLQVLHGEVAVGRLSQHGRERFERLVRGRPQQVDARVHEIFVQLTRGADGRVRRRDLVAIPTFRVRRGRRG